MYLHKSAHRRAVALVSGFLVVVFATPVSAQLVVQAFVSSRRCGTWMYHCEGAFVSFDSCLHDQHCPFLFATSLPQGRV